MCVCAHEHAGTHGAWTQVISLEASTSILSRPAGPGSFSLALFS